MNPDFQLPGSITKRSGQAEAYDRAKIRTAILKAFDGTQTAIEVRRLEELGFWLDEEANAHRSREPRVISRPGSPVTVLVVPTNEELAMAQETLAIIS